MRCSFAVSFTEYTDDKSDKDTDDDDLCIFTTDISINIIKVCKFLYLYRHHSNEQNDGFWPL